MRLVLAALLFAAGLLPAGAQPAPARLVSLLSDRPVFSYLIGGQVQTRSLAPGQRLNLEPGLFSGLGLKRVPLEAGGIYYLARIGSAAGLYRLGPEQVLVVNRSGRALGLRVEGSLPSGATLASSSFALADNGGQAVPFSWDDGTGPGQRQDLNPGTLYQWELGSPEGLGTSVILTAWD